MGGGGGRGVVRRLGRHTGVTGLTGDGAGSHATRTAAYGTGFVVVVVVVVGSAGGGRRGVAVAGTAGVAQSPRGGSLSGREAHEFVVGLAALHDG